MFSLRTQPALRRAVSVRSHVCPSCVRFNSSEATSFPENNAGPSIIKQIGGTKRSRTIFSGIQPTGVPHLGNYLGALREWVKLQRDANHGDQLIYSIVDLHAITVKQEREQLAKRKKELFASLLAIGLDPKRSIIFEQSRVPEHLELMWILSCNASMGYLGRMTQWKSKLALSENASPFEASAPNKPALKLGLFSYPVLQAADILVYGTTHVPVGEDQAQHLEFARDLAAGFNHVYAPHEGVEILRSPQTILSPAKRVMSLTDPTKKMSKSDPDPRSSILITDSKEEIRKKINGAKTDSLVGISYDRERRPGVSNLIDILCYMADDNTISPETLARDMGAANVSMKALKELVADTIDVGLRDVRGRYEDIMSLPIDHLSGLSKDGKSRARTEARKMVNTVYAALGLEPGFREDSWAPKEAREPRKPFV
ncbi:tryptophanyl-tRNA synthetase [Lentithecium fluviatile CBS 122367]|uniref:Tryptophan--tRNA ligase, mitochondrial n=1 Tax=Lentithecium fluviatile CBS 122367 TaxID=1168545 RepID=A0A6G1ILW5_9PLEO|nr:tryptophanyl-tRNA synthetase [Lentithecium fluviatile CBS 122367]